MKKITREEKEKMELKPPGHMTHLRSMLINMKVGDIIHLEKKDWKWKSKAPTALLRRFEHRRSERFTCLMLVSGDGWVVERVK